MTNPIPDAALEHHIAILGKTGSGKSNAAKTVAEGLLNAGERFCAIDPTGTWWGLRLMADGKTPSPWPIVIFGGQHADLPVDAAHGEAIAEAIATSSTPAIIDTRDMTVGKRTAFFAAFAQGLLRANRGALTLVIDEAHLFAPQGRVTDPRSGEMLHAANNLVSLGRGVGLRIVLISQRPAKLHKDSLTQVETMVAMRVIAPQDRRAIEDWIGEWTDPKQGREMISGLASMPKGDAIVWAPEQGVLERVHFPLVSTFDSGQPRAAEGVTLNPIDVDTIRERLAVADAEIAANDPKALKARIAELERAARKRESGADPEALAEAEQRGYERGRQESLTTIQQLDDLLRRHREHITSLREMAGRFLDESEAVGAQERPVEAPRPRPAPVAGNGRDKAAGLPPPEPDSLSPAEERVLGAIVSAYPRGLTYAAATARAGVSKRSSQYRRYRKNLIAAGLVEERDGRLYAAGDALAMVLPEPTGLDGWCARLPPSQANMLRVIASAHGLGKEEVAERAGVSPTSSGLGAGLRELADLALIERREGRYYPAEGLT